MSHLSRFVFPIVLAVCFAGVLDCGTALAQTAEMLRSEAYRQSYRNSYIRFNRALWNGKAGNIFFSPLLSEPEARPQMGFTEEQYQQLQELKTNIQENHPEAVAVRAELEPWNQKYPDGIYAMNTSEQEKKQYHAIFEKYSNVSLNILPEEIEKIVTPEQKQHLREYFIAAMSEFPVLNPDMFEALGLSDEQREQLQAIKKALEPELDEIAVEMADDHLRIFDKHFEAVEILENSGITKENTEAEEYEKKLNLETKRLIQADPEYRKKEKAARQKGMDFTRRLKFQMFDVLTDEQMEKMQKIISDPPDFVKKILDEARKNREESEKSDQWQPGPGSWQPGDPISEEYLEHRKARFPQKQNKS